MFEGLAGWLATITWPLITRVLAAAGMGTVTYVGATTALESALAGAKASFGALGADMLNIMLLSGFFDAMSISAGGLTGGLAWMVMKRWAITATGPT